MDFLYPNTGVSNCPSFSKLATYSLYLRYILPSEGLHHLQFCFDLTEKSVERFQYTLGENSGKQGFGERRSKPPLARPHAQSNSQLATQAQQRKINHPETFITSIRNAQELRHLQASLFKAGTGATVSFFPQATSLASSCVYSCI